MDKVLVNKAMQTLHVVALGLVCVTIFETLLSGIRTYVFAHTSSKIDVELGARLFHHLLALPIRYFQQRRVGDSVARVRELENIRTFLTGNALTLLLDVLFSIVLIAVMFCYSAKLTAIVAASIPLYLLLSLFFTPILRTRLNENFSAVRKIRHSWSRQSPLSRLSRRWRSSHAGKTHGKNNWQAMSWRA